MVDMAQCERGLFKARVSDNVTKKKHIRVSLCCKMGYHKPLDMPDKVFDTFYTRYEKIIKRLKLF